MRRREFITLLGGAAGTWPLAARAQQDGPMRRLGWLTSLAANDPQALARVTAFVQELQKLGWTVGRNLQIDYRFGAIDSERKRKFAAELVALGPDVMLATGDTNTAPLLQNSRTVPIVFVDVPDPVGAGFVTSLARPGGNATGLTNFDYAMSGKWLELLKQIAPAITRIAVFRDPTTPNGMAHLAAIQSVSPFLRVDASPIDVRNSGEFERSIAEFARTPNGGMLVPPSGLAQVHSQLIITLAARYRLPTVYAYRFFVTYGGLASYGPDQLEQSRLAAGYVDRILKGEKPADLPVQAPTKYATVLNLKTAKALGIDVPASVLARADEVIE
jgi:putative ABC transport system substrate-binding protein